MRDWKSVNDKYITEGELYLTFDFLECWRNEVTTLNQDKRGGQYCYPTSLFMFLYALKHTFHLGYRQEQGFLQSLQLYIPIPSIPSYSQIQRRSTQLYVDLNLLPAENSQIVAVDSSGIKLYNSGQWIREKHKKKGPFLKIHVAVNIKTKQVVAISITEDSVGDNKEALSLIDKAGEYAPICSGLFDGAYDTYEIWEGLEQRGIQPLIRLRKNAVADYWKSWQRAKTVKEYKKNEKKWVKEKGFGQRWQVETWFSSLKRRFGEHCTATKPRNVLHEVLFKTALCNKMIV